ncbi:MAG: PAS domain-containing protein [Puniceicoccales bacterium]|jgi:signal transduction histidine kinase|nr:PAS domain-containing protein [Puniceicoccales bacterium]
MKLNSLDKLLEKAERLDKSTLVSLAKKFRSQRNFFSAIVDVIRDGIVIVDPRGSITFSNRSAVALLGLTNSKNDNIFRYIPSVKIPVDSSVSTTDVEINYPAKLTIKVCSIPFSEDSKNMRILIMSDVTNEILLHKKEIEDERTSSVLLLAASIAHEIGNPLNSIHLQLELLEQIVKKHPTNRQICESIKICQQEISRLNGIIKNFLQAIRPTPPVLGDLDVCDIIEAVIKLMHSELENANIALSLGLNEHIKISADADQLKQMFFNVMKNALEAIGSDGQISIDMFSDEEFLKVQISDSGIGINPMNVGHIFDPFFTSKKNGNGLGMLIIQRILRAHNARMNISSLENRGTTVTIEFPLKTKRAKMLITK